MYNKKGPMGKAKIKATPANVRKDKAFDKKKGIKEGSGKDNKIDKLKFGKKV